MTMRFSLRGLLGGVTAAAIALALLHYLTIEYRQQLAIRSDLQSMGAYYVRFGDDMSIHVAFHNPVTSLKIANYPKIKVLDFKEAHITDESLKNLSGLDSLDLIVLSLSDVQDDHLRHLKSLGQVRHLWLTRTGVTDACVDFIIDVPGLERVDITQTLITPSGIERLRAARPSLIINK